jgi:two-component system, chemotaxis family, sensor histidine kinase and response regulator PixL
MDTEQQVRLHFLDEAEDCIDSIETVVLGLSTAIAQPQELDQALRAAHSVKGGAAMMRFTSLSQVAHRMEDFLKILRVRYQSTLIDTAVETLLLQGVDCLRQVNDLHRQDQTVDDAWLDIHVHPLFAELRHHLGDLKPEDEDALLFANEAIDPALFLFENGVEASLDNLESQLSHLQGEALRQEVTAVAEELAEFGRMANLESFVALCASVQEQLQTSTPEQLTTLAQEAAATWRRSHALVQLGRSHDIPSSLATADQPLQELGTEFIEASEDISHLDLVDLAGISTVTNLVTDIVPEWDQLELAQLDLNHLDTVSLDSLDTADFDATDFDAVSIDSLDPSTLDDVALNFDAIAIDMELEAAFAIADLTSLPDSFLKQTAEVLPEHPVVAIPESSAMVTDVVNSQQAMGVSNRQVTREDAKSHAALGRTVRVPVQQLQKTNTLLGELILERNAINLRLEQLRTFSALFTERMRRLEESNTQLRKWYDCASMEGIISVPNQSLTSLSGTVGTGTAPSLSARAQSAAGEFDALEMDRYTDLHLISQEQIETIVQLQEVRADFELELREISQAVRDLNQTTRVLQSSFVRTQMVPFADVVKRFPRVVRDLAVQFGKQVNLKIAGEATLIDRSILDVLADPLNHLLRNAFDHGIESPADRIAAGKPAEGTITLQAAHRGGHTVITIRDDGQGIAQDKICDRLRKMGLPEAEIEAMSPTELYNWIFEPGFSTAGQVTELSGRGVGMDIVRTNLREVRGDIQIDTQPGVGTTFTLRVPFALSILRVMLLERAGMVMAVPADSINEVVRFDPEQVSTLKGVDYLNWQGKSVPLVRLEQGLAFQRSCKRFEMPGTPKINQTTVLIVGEGEHIRGIYIDRFWGEQEVTIKAIASPIPLPPGFGQSTILGDGRVVPLVDPLTLAESVRETSLAQSSQAQAGMQSTGLPIQSSVAQTKTILVVDDSINVRQYLALILEKAGYQVEQAKDGQDAVDKLLDGLSVQAVICDIEMPRLDGYGVLNSLRGQALFQQLPIVMLTSRSSDKHRKLAMNLGASAYFSKPFTEQELLQKIEDLIQQLSLGQTSKANSWR